MSSPTSKIKVFTDVKFQPGSTLTRDTRNSFPLNPEVGMDTMVNGVYYYYGAPDGESTITSAPDNEIDTLIKNTSFQPKKEITFHPHKQRYKPSYTLIPLASSGYYDISQNDLMNLADLETEAKKNINLPVLNDTRAMSNLTNFKITL